MDERAGDGDALLLAARGSAGNLSRCFSMPMAASRSLARARRAGLGAPWMRSGTEAFSAAVSAGSS